MLLGMALLVLLGRPLALLADSLVRNNAVVPGVTSLIRWQSHWHVVRQSWPFFQNDFAGRIANRVMQTGNAVRECVVVEHPRGLVHRDLRHQRAGADGLSPTGAWPCRRRCGSSATSSSCATSCRACATSPRPARRCARIVMGRVVDSYTNILTVKLFARARDEDAYVREVIDDHTGAIARAHAAHHALHVHAVGDERAAAGRARRRSASCCGRTALIERRHRRDRAAAGLADRQRRRLGELGGDRHLREHRRRAGRHADDRRAAHAASTGPDARELAVPRGEIRFEHLTFTYGRSRRPARCSTTST